MRRNQLMPLAVAFILLGAVAGAVIYTNNVVKSSEGRVDFEAELVTEEGSRMFRISELRGKITILEFTYIGCSGCEYLHRTGYMQQLYSKYKDKIEIVSIFLYYPYDSLDYIRRYREEFKINWKYMAVYRSGDLIMELKLPALFTHLFLDEDGFERFRKVGNINYVKEMFPYVIELMLEKDYETLKELSDPIEG